MNTFRPLPRHPAWRRRRTTLEQPDRRALERSGWRTLLDYSENHVRDHNGRLLSVQPRWIAEAERVRGEVLVATATATTIDDAWAKLRQAVREREVVRSAG